MNELAVRERVEHPILTRAGLSWSEKVAFLAVALQQAPQAECPLEHKFEPGLYRRIIKIPAGVSFIGRPHLTGHLCRLLEGRLIWILNDGGTREIEAPFELRTTRGTQLVLYTLSDIVAETVHENPFGVEDPKVLEPAIFESEASVLRRGREVSAKLLVAREAAASYAALLTTYGVDDGWANALSMIEEDMVDDENDKIEVGASLIHGHGCFARRSIVPQEVVGAASIRGCRTPLGRYTNHSGRPNVFPRYSDGKVLWIANQHVSPDTEIVVNYLESLAVARLAELKCQELSLLPQPP